MLALVKRSFACIDTVTLPLLYKSLVRPHLEYGNLVWGPFNRADQKLVERVQRRGHQARTRVAAPFIPGAAPAPQPAVPLPSKTKRRYDHHCRDLYNRGSSDNDHELAREFVDPRKNNCVNFSKRHFLS